MATLKLLEASDRFACTDLKMELEANIVKNFLTKESAIELLMFADSHTCALLAESATVVICCYRKQIKSSSDWKLIQQSPEFQSKILEHVFSDSHSNGSDSSSSLDEMDVSSLRKRLAYEGEDYDGSKETLVRRCKKLRNA